MIELNYSNADSLIFLGFDNSLLEVDVFQDLGSYCQRTVVGLSNVPPVITKQGSILACTQALQEQDYD